MKIYDEGRRKPKGQFHIMTEEEIRNILTKNNIPQNTIDTLIQTNTTIADQIDVQIDLNQALFPNYETPDDIKELYEENKDTLLLDE